ncbi:Oidioi.mRNA.OKI2018_I69.PAR.g13146.t1.cds [Oikopleura dioica]|uniref:Oidioi.mRNA.OKI2018_I69.PAR.g13146.t1.cds n=1 Tax=Oikopleura dioica TaxID=34765 RepID=A0ABN7S7U8_OIKDI|nr:Oidioi.mRNA.OKI2018_I69.PAR.g13146.t1.cds [Oikopleura dioica]
MGEKVEYLCVICDDLVPLPDYLTHTKSHPKCASCSLRLCPNMDSCAVEEPASKKFRGNHEKILMCPFPDCSSRFALPNKFQRHHSTKHSTEAADKKTLSCSEENCPFTTIHRESLTRHMREQHRSKKTPLLSCDKCDYKTQRKSNMERHKSAYHKAEEGEGSSSFICDMCGKNFKSTATLNNHNLNSCKFRVVPPGETPFSCDFKLADGKTCGKVVSCPQSLAKHKERHKSFKYRCNFYAHCFRTDDKEKVQRHNKKHIETWAKEPLKCTNKDCPFGASSAQSIANHKKICDKRQIPDRQSVIVLNDRFQKEEIIHPSVIIRRKEYVPDYLSVQNFDDHFSDFNAPGLFDPPPERVEHVNVIVEPPTVQDTFSNPSVIVFHNRNF